MINLNSERTEIVNGKKEQHKTTENKTRILVVDGHPTVRQELIQLINQEADIGVCVGARSTDQALNAVKKQQFDLAVVDVSLDSTKGTQFAEEIKLQCPNLPVLILSTHDEALYAKHALRAGTKEYVVNEEATEQIIKAVRYVQSLLRSRVFGFTVLVRIEGSD